MVQIHTSTGGIPVQRVMLTDFRTLQPDDTLASAIEHILAGWQQDFPVVFGDHVLGVLTREDLLRTLARRGSEGLVRDAMNREFQTADSHDMLEKALALLQKCKCRSLPVVHDERLVGMLTMDNVGEFLTIQSALRQAHRTPSGSLSEPTAKMISDSPRRVYPLRTYQRRPGVGNTTQKDVANTISSIERSKDLAAAPDKKSPQTPPI